MTASPDTQPWLLHQIQLGKKKNQQKTNKNPLKSIHISFAQHGPFFNIISMTHSVDVSPSMIKNVPTIFQKVILFERRLVSIFSATVVLQTAAAHDGRTVQAPVPNDDSFDREYR